MEIKVHGMSKVQKTLDSLSAFLSNTETIEKEAVETAQEEFTANLADVTPRRAAHISSDIKKSSDGHMMLEARGDTLIGYGGKGFNILMGVEFGAGAFYNDAVNTSFPDMPMGVGTYPDQIHALQSGWAFPISEDEYGYTHGTPATMPMHRTILAMRSKTPQVAKEAVKGWIQNRS